MRSIWNRIRYWNINSVWIIKWWIVKTWSFIEVFIIMFICSETINYWIVVIIINIFDSIRLDSEWFHRRLVNIKLERIYYWMKNFFDNFRNSNRILVVELNCCIVYWTDLWKKMHFFHQYSRYLWIDWTEVQYKHTFYTLTT